MTQFLYTRKETIPPKEGEEAPTEVTFKFYKDSFDLDKVIRTMEIEDGRRLVLLNDIHERAQQVPDIDVKTNKMKGFRRERNTFQSEIFLEPEDSARFIKLIP